jgi:adenylate cyclase
LAKALPSTSLFATRRASNLEAYDLFVRGRVLAIKSPEDNRIAQSLLEKSIEIDPSFASAHAWLAVAHSAAWAYFGEPMERNFNLSPSLGERAVTLDPGNADAHSVFGYVLMFNGRSEEGETELLRALEINPNHADAWHSRANSRRLREIRWGVWKTFARRSCSIPFSVHGT